MVGTNGQSGSKPNMGMPERPPVTKKSKTEPTDASGSDDSQAAAHPPSPIFPAGRRVSPTPSVNSASSTATPAVTYLGGGTSSNDSDAFSFNFSDRDYVFPSNLGPYSTRRNLSIKSSSSSSSLSKQQGSAQFPAPSTSMPPNFSSSTVDSARRSSRTKLKADKDLKTLSLQASTAALATSPRVPSIRDPAHSSSIQKSSSFGSAWRLKFLMFLSTLSLMYMIGLRYEVARLEGSLLKQLAIANKSIGGGVIVVLAERNKEEMEMDIAKLEFDLMGTSVICRSGSPLILADLKKVSVSKARAIIVLASDENADQSDARALRVVLSLTGVKEGLRGHIVVEMSDLDNEPLVKLVGGELIETVVAHDVIGRLMIQCALQPGLAQIWEDILGFENAEFYIKRWPELDGTRFEDVLVSFPDAIPCGVKVAADGGKIKMNPGDKYVLKEGDEILVIAEDDDTYAPSSLPELRKGLSPRITDPPKFPEKILFCGWRRDIDDMIMVLEALLAPGSELWMFNEVPVKDRHQKLTDGGLDILGLVNIKLVHRDGNAVIRRHLESLPLETFDSILILADESVEDSIVHSDSRSLATLLLIRDIQSKRLPYKDAKSIPLRHSGFSQSSWIREMQQASDKSIIISEILDSRTRNLVSVTRISDYVLSNELVSMALAMVAEDKQINRVLEELFAEEGNEMCIKPAECYLYDQEELCFYEIMIRGRQRKEIVIGYRLATAEHAVINPVGKLMPQKWSINDVFVVISSGK